ncbi:MAG: cyclic nucleotide-binding domain-containing protein [Myxococcota bacterium]
MAFLDPFGPTHRALLEGAAATLRLRRGELLIRRGDPAGDVFLVQSGALEAVDTRTTPEVILNTLAVGAVVGEMAFVDGAPRSVDVRAGADTTVLRWSREDLAGLLLTHPDLGAAFYEHVARLAIARVRVLTEGAVTGAYGGKEAEVADAGELQAWVARISEQLKLTLPPAETALRRDPDDRVAQQQLRDALDTVETEVDALLTAVRDPAARTFASEALGRELHPYLVRSSLAERSIRRSQGVAGTAEILAHVLVDTAGGDGRVGELIDRWLLDRPTFRALRALNGPLTEAVARHLPAHRNRRLLLVNAGTGSLVARLAHELRHPPTVITVLDQSRDALALIDIGRNDGPAGVEIHTIQENLARFATGRGRFELPQQDAIVIHGLVEYLPERMAVSLLTLCKALLTDEGVVALATVGPSRDRALLDRLLAWPTLRRSPEALQGLLVAARLQVVGRPEVEAPAQILVCAADDRTLVARPDP